MAVGVRIKSYRESWNEAPGEIGEVLYAIAGWVAKMESQRQSERTKAGLARDIAQGKKLGRPQGEKTGRSVAEKVTCCAMPVLNCEKNIANKGV